MPEELELELLLLPLEELDELELEELELEELELEELELDPFQPSTLPSKSSSRYIRPFNTNAGSWFAVSKFQMGLFWLSYSKFQFSYSTVPLKQVESGAAVGQRNWAKLAGVPGWP